MVVKLFLLLIGILVLGAATLFLVYKYPNSKKIFQIVYLVLIVVFGYLLVDSIMTPIHFKEDVKVRYDATVQNLKDIRTLQETYKDKYGKYTGDFDTLTSFWTDDSIVINGIYQVSPWNQDEMTKAQAIKAGVLVETETLVAVSDSIFTTDYTIETLRTIPYSQNIEFTMGAGIVETGSKVEVKVFEAYALFDDLLRGMDKQLIINYKDNVYQITEFYGIKVGSLEEANNNAGNWEK